ncbi:PCC domain-containing protein [Delftia sp. NA_296.1]|uniref:PCC domain-containing protein n=1 Tax=Delftia sp. NA_296.1 TaxID=3415648 RepID=UPI004045446B
MPERLAGLPRPRTLIHPGPCSVVRLDHRQAPAARHLRLALAPGLTLFEAIVGALSSASVESASLTLLEGDLEDLDFCVAPPDRSGHAVATYGPPATLRSARLLFGNATLGRAETGTPAVHCHAVFSSAQGQLLGGHVLTQSCRIANAPISALATSLEGFGLRIAYDPETRMPLMRPATAQVRHG